MRIGLPRRAAWETLVRAIYVPTCAFCDRRGSWLCDQCEARLRPIGRPGCARCGALERFACECSMLPAELSALHSVYPFDGWVRAAIHRLKFDGERARAPMLAESMAGMTSQLRDVDGLVPVPIHKRRLRQRGFNQSELLAIGISAMTQIPVLHALERIEDRGSQVGRSGPDRWLAVEGAFECRQAHAVSGLRLLVIDDVITTGATISSCAQALVRAGAVAVHGLSLARG